MPQAFSYIRFSTPEQIKGDSLRRQFAKSQEWCKRNGYTLDESLNLRDLGVSGFKGANIEAGRLGAFLDAVKEGRVSRGSVLLCENLDRLTRAHIRTGLTLMLGLLSAGITIVTIDPEYRFEPDSGGDDVTQLLIAIISLSRGHGESARKSYLGGEAWKQKRAIITDKKLTAKCPAWLKLNEDRTKFLVIPEKVAIIQRIFRLAIEGHGLNGITKRLNGEGVKALGHGKAWHASYVQKILNNRSVLGEYQPHTGHGALERKPIGDPIPDYYPPIISEADFYRAGTAKESRKTNARGPIGKSVANLFTGLLRDAFTGANMTLVNKGGRSNGIKLVSAAARRGEQGSHYCSFPYEAFESGMIEWTKEIKASDLVGNSSSGGIADELTVATGRLGDLDIRLSAFRESLATDPNFKTILTVVRQLETERNELVHKIEKLKGELHDAGSRPLAHTQDLARLLQVMTGQERYDLRLKLRAAFATLLEEVWVLISELSGQQRQAMVQVHFKGGEYRRLVMITERNGNLQSWGQTDLRAGELGTWDLRTFRQSSIKSK